MQAAVHAQKYVRQSCVASLLSRFEGSSSSLDCMALQVRHRQWLYPRATKAWRPNRFEHEGKAMQHARESKRIQIWKLSLVAGISKYHLQRVEEGTARLLPQERETLERYLGVPLKSRRKPRIERTP
mmetsp:Transcript_43894/g.80212  ORF Transcript_43894/g.80212 Transcript_43894/m.80212 type:complete len:127 (+) Transcript_43894:64-444(+)